MPITGGIPTVLPPTSCPVLSCPILSCPVLSCPCPLPTAHCPCWACPLHSTHYSSELDLARAAQAHGVDLDGGSTVPTSPHHLNAAKSKAGAHQRRNHDSRVGEHQLHCLQLVHSPLPFSAILLCLTSDKAHLFFSFAAPALPPLTCSGCSSPPVPTPSITTVTQHLSRAPCMHLPSLSAAPAPILVYSTSMARPFRCPPQPKHRSFPSAPHKTSHASQSSSSSLPPHFRNRNDMRCQAPQARRCETTAHDRAQLPFFMH